MSACCVAHLSVSHITPLSLSLSLSPCLCLSLLVSLSLSLSPCLSLISFSEHLCVSVDPCWDSLLLLRERLLNHTTLEQYLGYAIARLGENTEWRDTHTHTTHTHAHISDTHAHTSDTQVTTTTSPARASSASPSIASFSSSSSSPSPSPTGVSGKMLCHAMRLLLEAKRIVDLSTPLVYWQGEERQDLLRIRAGTHTREHKHTNTL